MAVASFDFSLDLTASGIIKVLDVTVDGGIWTIGEGLKVPSHLQPEIIHGIHLISCLVLQSKSHHKGSLLLRQSWFCHGTLSKLSAGSTFFWCARSGGLRVLHR